MKNKIIPEIKHFYITKKKSNATDRSQYKN